MSFCSKLDEKSKEAQLDYLLPQHELFHQYFVMADSESQLFREKSRGLSGGSFLLATLLNRQDVKTKKGKDAIDSFKDFFLLKADGTFNNYFLHKYKLNLLIDNTPSLLKKASSEKKRNYLHDLVAEALKDLLPYFKNAKVTSDMLMDFPLASGRKDTSDLNNSESVIKEQLKKMHVIDIDIACATAEQIQSIDKTSSLKDFMFEVTKPVSSSRSCKEYSCSMCSFKTKYMAVCTSHIEHCLKKQTLELANVMDATSFVVHDDIEEADHMETSDSDKEEADFYWNYKTCEFMQDSLFAITTVYESFGNGLGCFIVSKMLLPIFHGLKHSNYTGSIHRFNMTHAS